MALSINDVYSPVRIELSALNQPRKSPIDSLVEIVGARKQRKAEERKMKLLEAEAADRRKMNDLLFQEKEMNLNKAREDRMNDRMIETTKNTINETYGPMSSALSLAAGGVPIPTTLPRGVAEKAGVDMLRGQGREKEAREIENYALMPAESFAKMGLHDQANQAAKSNPVAVGALGGGKIDFTPSDQEDILLRPDGSQFRKVTSGNGKVSLERIKGPDPIRELKGDPYGGLSAVTWEDGKAPSVTQLRGPVVSHGSGSSGGGRSSGGGAQSSREVQGILRSLSTVQRQRSAIEKQLADLNDLGKSAGMDEGMKKDAIELRQRRLAELQKAEQFYTNRHYQATGYHPDEAGDGLGFSGAPAPAGAPALGGSSGRDMLTRLRALKDIRNTGRGPAAGAPAAAPSVTAAPAPSVVSGPRPGINETYAPLGSVAPAGPVFQDPLAVDYSGSKPKGWEDKSLLDFYVEDVADRFQVLRKLTGSDEEALARLEDERRRTGDFAP